MNRTVLMMAVAMGLGLCSSAKAVTTWFFSSNPDHSLGSSTATYTVGAVTITASGFYNDNKTTNPHTRTLYDKFTTSVTNAESGLGFLDDTFGNHEIDTSGYIVLDLSNAFFNNQSLSLSITSIQAGESYQWYRGSALNNANLIQGLTLMGSFLSASPLTFTGGGNDKFIAIEASSANVLINSLAVSAVPEPRFYGILLIGMLGLAGMVWRKRRVAE